MSSSLLSEPSTVKLLPRDLKPLTANCPALPTPAPTPGPATEPKVCGGGATPGSSSASSSKVRVKVEEPSGSVETSSSVNEPPCRASVVERRARTSVSSCVMTLTGAGCAGVAAAPGDGDAAG